TRALRRPRLVPAAQPDRGPRGAAWLRPRDSARTGASGRRRDGGPAQHAESAAGDQSQRRRGRAAVALSLQHLAVPDRQAGADRRAVHDRPGAAPRPRAGVEGAADARRTPVIDTTYDGSGDSGGLSITA